jgi:alpha-tubulin suppressor-like RCC1 family protein
MLTLPGSGSLREFQDISGGGNHMLALNKRSELFAWGRNTRGQLGLAYHTQAELKPLLVASAASTDVTHLATGGCVRTTRRIMLTRPFSHLGL